MAQNFLRTISSIFSFDKVRVALFVTWIWAYFGLKLAHILEKFFLLILKMPDSWFDVGIVPKQNTKGQKIHILAAHDGQHSITNKLKLFMKFYWEQGGPTHPCATNGFDFGKLSQLLNCSMLYCSYLLTDKDGILSPEEFYKNVNQFLVEMQNDTCYKSTKQDLSDRKTLFLRNVDFDLHEDEEITADAGNVDINDIDDIIAHLEM